MIKVYRFDNKGERHLLTTFLDQQSETARAYAESRARRTREDHIVVYGDGTDMFVYGDPSSMPF